MKLLRESFFSLSLDSISKKAASKKKKIKSVFPTHSPTAPVPTRGRSRERPAPKAESFTPRQRVSQSPTHLNPNWVMLTL